MIDPSHHRYKENNWKTWFVYRDVFIFAPNPVTIYRAACLGHDSYLH